MADGDPLVVVAEGLDTYVAALGTEWSPNTPGWSGRSAPAAIGGGRSSARVRAAGRASQRRPVTDLRPWTGTSSGHPMPDLLPGVGRLDWTACSSCSGRHRPFPLVHHRARRAVRPLRRPVRAALFPVRAVARSRRLRRVPPNPRGARAGATSSPPPSPPPRAGGVDRHPHRRRPALSPTASPSAALGICGWSHGGFMTAWAIGHTDRFAAASWGPASPTGACSSPAANGPCSSRAGRQHRLGGRQARTGTTSSAHLLRSQRAPPVLIVHGAATPTSHRPVRVLPTGPAALGTVHEFVVYPRGPLFRDRATSSTSSAAPRWFDRWL